jgi:hypothetical protein
MSKRKAPQPGESITRRELEPQQIVTLECPLGEIPPDVYLQRHVEVQLSSSQAATLRRLVEALDLSRVRLGSNRRVTTGSDAVRYLLEQLAAASVSQETAR